MPTSESIRERRIRRIRRRKIRKKCAWHPSLWPIPSAVGDSLELTVVQLKQSRHRGCKACAMLLYASEFLSSTWAVNHGKKNLARISYTVSQLNATGARFFALSVALIDKTPGGESAAFQLRWRLTSKSSVLKSRKKLVEYYLMISFSAVHQPRLPLESCIQPRLQLAALLRQSP
jgi:hypothetical protein